jgi:hypothetical protein
MYYPKFYWDTLRETTKNVNVAAHVIGMAKIRNARRIFVGKLQRKRQSGNIILKCIL